MKKAAETEVSAACMCSDHSALCLSLLHYTTLFDASLLAGEATEVVKLRTAHFAVFVDGDGLDERRFHREDAFYADSVGNLADCEALFVLMAVDADHHATVLLDTLFVTFFDAVGNGDCVAGAEIGVLFVGCKCLFGYLD